MISLDDKLILGAWRLIIGKSETYKVTFLVPGLSLFYIKQSEFNLGLTFPEVPRFCGSTNIIHNRKIQELSDTSGSESRLAQKAGILL
jgi:hypothetical protein